MSGQPDCHGLLFTRRDDRGQSTVVGVALLLGATVIALGALTMAAGTLVDEHVARADADRVAADLDNALRPVETTGHRSGRVGFANGRLHTVERELRIMDASGVVATVPIDGLVFERGERRVAAVAGGIARGQGESVWLVREPPIVSSERNDVLVVGAVNLTTGHQSIGGEGASTTIATNVSHSRRSLGDGTYAVAVETALPAAFEQAFEEQNATIERRDLDGDGVPSVVASYPGTRMAHLVEHDVRVEVTNG